MYIGSEFMLLEANNEQLARENEKLAEALKAMQETFGSDNPELDGYYDKEIEVCNQAKRALHPYQGECTCLPDLPDGRGRGHCPVCEAKPKEIPIGGE